MLIVKLFDKNIELYLLNLLTRNKVKKENLNIFDTVLWLNALKSLFWKEIASWLVILCYIKLKKQMSKTQAKKLSLKFVPYLFIAVTILTTFGSNTGTWAWTNSNLMV